MMQFYNFNFYFDKIIKIYRAIIMVKFLNIFKLTMILENL